MSFFVNRQGKRQPFTLRFTFSVISFTMRLALPSFSRCARISGGISTFLFHRCGVWIFICTDWLATAPSLIFCCVLCAVASFLLLAWMRTAILAGIAVVRFGLGRGVRVCSLATGLQARQRLEQKKLSKGRFQL